MSATAAEEAKKVLDQYDPLKFGAVISDNGGGCPNARKDLLKMENCAHMLEER